MASVGHSDDVKSWLPSANQGLFAQQGREFTGLSFPNNGPGLLENMPCLFVLGSRQEIAQQTRAKGFGFTDIDQATERIEDPVDTWRVGNELLDEAFEFLLNRSSAF